jgi:hypothetical protein
VGAVNDDGDEDSSLGGLRAAKAEGGGGVKGTNMRGVSNGRRQGTGRLRFVL